MKCETEILLPESYIPATNWLMKDQSSTKWTAAENKLFENALAIHDKDTPDRWHKVAAMIHGKTVGDVIRQYEELEIDVNNIEAGLIPIPGYNSTNPSPFNLDCGFYGYRDCSYSISSCQRSSNGRPAEHERKKGMPWTEEEHKLFLLGLKKYGKGDWRNISRNFVVSRTPTQVASHAQKYFIRQLSGGKDKRRASIHDITTVNLNDTRNTSPDHKRPPSPRNDQSSVLQHQQNSAAATMQWSQPHMAFNSTHGNMFGSSPYEHDSYGFKLQTRNYIAPPTPQCSAFQIRSTQHRPHG